MSTEETSEEQPQMPVVVEMDHDEWIVKNEGDSAVLFKSADKDAAVKFAQDMASQHSIELKVFEEGEKSRRPDRDEKRDEDRRDERENEEKEEERVEHDLVVSRSDGEWKVCHEDDTAVLFSAPNREQAEKFARQMAEEHKIGVKIRD